MKRARLAFYVHYGFNLCDRRVEDENITSRWLHVTCPHCLQKDRKDV